MSTRVAARPHLARYKRLWGLLLISPWLLGLLIFKLIPILPVNIHDQFLGFRGPGTFIHNEAVIRMDLLDRRIPLFVNELHDLFFGELPLARGFQAHKKAEIVFGDCGRKKSDVRDL